MNPRIRTLLIVPFALAVLAACTPPGEPATDPVLTVQHAGTGSGTVTSEPAGIDTSGVVTDTATFAPGTDVTLTAQAAEGSTFTGFSENCEVDDLDENTCVVDMTTSRTVTATFVADTVDPTPRTLTVAVNETGSASGTVTSDPEGIDCPEDCAAEFPGGSTVTLTAAAVEGFFTGWSGGDCAGQTGPTCTVTMGPDEPTVTATFGDDDPGQEVTVTRQVTTSADSGEEFLQNSASNPTNWPTGWTWNTSSDLDLGYDTTHGPQVVGVRFADLGIPAGAQIQSATVTFTAMSGTTGSGTNLPLTITAQASTTPAAFANDPNTQPSFDITNRSTVDGDVAWTVTNAWSSGQTYSTPDLSELLQDVVDLGGWSTASGVVFIIDAPLANTQYRRAVQSGDTGPLLTVTYTGGN